VIVLITINFLVSGAIAVCIGLFVCWLYEKIKGHEANATINGEVVEINESDIRNILKKEIETNQR